MDDQNARISSRGKIAFIGFLLTAGFFLFSEHSAHALGVLPFLIFLACPLMHMFMHNHQGTHAHAQGEGQKHTAKIIDIGRKLESSGNDAS